MKPQCRFLSRFYHQPSWHKWIVRPQNDEIPPHPCMVHGGVYGDLSPPGQVQRVYGLCLSHWGLSSVLFDTPTPLSALLPGCPLSARFRSHSPSSVISTPSNVGYSATLPSRLEWQAFSKPDQFYTETMPKKNMCHPNVAGFVQ